jgi:ATP-dependent RNA helicase RhlE
MSRTLVFTSTKRGADKVAQHLDSRRRQGRRDHGNKSQRRARTARGSGRQDPRAYCDGYCSTASTSTS